MAQDSNIQDDIAFMRGLAEEGRRGPVLGGSILLACGLIYSTAAVLSWAFWARVLPFERPVPMFEWWLGLAAQAVAMVILIPRLKSRAGAETPNTRLFGAVWQSLGYSILATALGLALLNVRFERSIVWTAMPLAVLVLYGSGWAINAAILKRRWMYAAAALSYVSAVLTAYMVDRPEGMLGYGAIIFTVLVIPGILLMRETSLDGSPA